MTVINTSICFEYKHYKYIVNASGEYETNRYYLFRSSYENCYENEHS